MSDNERASSYNRPMYKPKVALVHDYLIQYGGGEKTLEALIQLYPEAPIVTSIYKPKNMSELINSKKIIHRSNFLLSSFSKYLTFLIPIIFESFDLNEYDIIISDSASYAKGVLTNPDQLHISYIHTPPRFLYGYSFESAKRNAWYFKPFVMVIDALLRTWDFGAAQRPDYLLANSIETQKRIKKFYKRASTVIYPPMDVIHETPTVKNNFEKPYYVALGRLVAYKNFDLVVEAFNMMELDLVVIGTGNEEKKLKRIANKNVKFVGQVDDLTKHNLLANCLGVINPVKDEDLGIVPVEAMSHGKPVLAHKSGGHLETIIDGVTGQFFEELSIENLIERIKEFDTKIRNKEFDPETIIIHSQKFSTQKFKTEIKEFVDEKWESLVQKNSATQE